MLTIWSSTPSSRILSEFSPVFKHCPDLPVRVEPKFVFDSTTKIILALGQDALEHLKGATVVPKNRTLSSLRTILHYYQKTPLLLSYSPRIGVVDHRQFVDLLTDVGLAVRYLQTGSMKPQFGKYEWVPDFSQLIAKIEAKRLVQPCVDMMKDTETVGLNPYREPDMHHPGAYIVTLQATCEKGEAYLVRFNSRAEEEAWFDKPENIEQMEYLLRSPWIKMKGANFKYDLHWLWVRSKKRLRCTNFVFDTTVVGSLLDENRSNDLGTHVKIYAPRLAGYADHYDKHADKDRMDLELKKDQEAFMNYAGPDVDAGLEVAEVEKKTLLEDSVLTGFYVNILHPAVRAFEDIEQGGMVVDLNAFKELKADLEAAHIKNVIEATKIMGGRIFAKHHDDSKLGGMNLTKASMLRDFMFTPMGLNLKPRMFTPKPDKSGDKVPSTSMEHLEMFADDPNAKDFIKIIDEDGSVMKTHSTYVVGFLSHLRSDNRLHPTYFLFVGNKDDGDGGAVTGRLSCHDPAFQVIPKHTKWAKPIRRCFPAPPGFVVVEKDYSQGELRVIACIANCQNMIQVYLNNQDLHVRTGARAAKITFEAMVELENTNEELFGQIRQKGKVGNFGLVFGMSAKGFVVYARSNYGVVFELFEAEDFKEEYFKEYPELLVYHDVYKKFARKNLFVRSPLGRVRHLPLVASPFNEVSSRAERQAINAPVQSTLTDMMLWAFALNKEQGLTAIAPDFGACHDAGYSYCPEDKIDDIIPKQVDIMENLPFEKVGWKPQLKFLADAKYGPNMADLVKFKK